MGNQPDARFRKAETEDLERLVQLLADDPLGASREDVAVPVNQKYLTAFDHINNDSNNELIVATIDGQLAGMLQLTFIPYLTYTGSWRCLIEGVRVDEVFRGQGLGKKLIQWSIARAKQRGCHLVQLTTDKKRPDAIRFYKQLGFTASHEGFKLKLV